MVDFVARVIYSYPPLRLKSRLYDRTGSFFCVSHVWMYLWHRGTRPRPPAKHYPSFLCSNCSYPSFAATSTLVFSSPPFRFLTPRRSRPPSCHAPASKYSLDSHPLGEALKLPSDPSPSLPSAQRPGTLPSQHRPAASRGVRPPGQGPPPARHAVAPGPLRRHAGSTAEE